MYMNKSVVLLAVSLVLAAPAHAVVVSGTLTAGSAFTNGGVFQIVTPGPGFTVGGNEFGNNNVRAVNELQKITLLSNLAVRGGSIAAGTIVNSQLLNFDPLVNRSARGTVTFNGRILGLATTQSLLNASNFLGRPGVTYSFVSASGLEGGDVVTFAGNVLTYNISASNPSDTIRVLTAVPEPASWAMLIAGFGLIGAVSRRRRAQAPVTA